MLAAQVGHPAEASTWQFVDFNSSSIHHHYYITITALFPRTMRDAGDGFNRSPR
jgi:hypothetical protein